MRERALPRCWYLPRRYLVVVGRRLDARGVSGGPTATAFRRLERGAGRDYDWSVFYEVQSKAWGWLSEAGLLVAMSAALLAFLDVGPPAAWGVVLMVGISICAACLSFESIIQAHVYALFWQGGGGRSGAFFARYFAVPNCWNLTIVPVSFIGCLILTLPAVS